MEALLTAASAVETRLPELFPRDVQIPASMDTPESQGSVIAPRGTALAPETLATYKPQFSMTGSSILKRMGNGTKGRSSVAPMELPSGNGDSMGVTVQPSHQLSCTLVLPPSRASGLEQSLSDVSGAAKRFIHSYSPSLKRKRSPDSSDTDFTQSTIPFRAPEPRTSDMTASVPRTHDLQAGAASPPKCLKCDQSTSTPENTFTTCKGCSKSWHQGCLPPPSTDGAAKASRYLCLECEAGNKLQSSFDDTEVQDRGSLVDRISRKRMSNFPPGVVPAKPEFVGFFAKQASSAERTEYFYNKKRTDLLNILSLCDQIKPQLLVDILVSVSRKHPDLPIFDDPDWRANLPSATSRKRIATTQRSRVNGRPRHGHTLVHPKASRKVKGSRKVLKRITVMKVEDKAPAEDGEEEEEEEEEEEDTLPPTWPKAGEGLYAKLPPEDEDRLFLEDDNDEEAFSHFMVDKFGKQIAVAVACA